MATIVEYYEVFADAGWNRLGENNPVAARFLSLNAAEEYAKLDHYRYVSKTKRKLIVFDTVKEVELQHRENLRQSALKKLTDEERLILGV